MVRRPISCRNATNTSGDGGYEVTWRGSFARLRCPRHHPLLSRAYSYDALGSFVAMPVGQVLYGPLGDALGYRPVLVVSGLVFGAACLLTLASRSVRNLERAPAPIAEPASSPP